MKHKVSTAARIPVEDVWCDFFAQPVLPAFKVKVIAFAVTPAGDLVGITVDPNGNEDFCERQIPNYTLRYYGREALKQE